MPMNILRRLAAGLCAAALALTAAPGPAAAADPENTLVIELESGPVLIEMLPDLAPRHVERIKTLARAGAYDGVIFHRVIEGFMAQTGDVRYGRADRLDLRRAGMGGSDLPNLPAEFSNIAAFERGAVGMARGRDPDSANSQFFIMFRAAPHLNGQYTLWGRVISGMEHVDRIARGEPPRNPDRMLRVYVQADR
ncbi:peptidylprolyl isomerase [Oceanicella actignis]|uniref:Peptidyl-prolyl cis-trans isomerase n=2 Tax=Oceanicella actignis TaxID=1189325 RepID=A0A1M7RUG8_9RHOB|nr:peptidylprolyl isomerase [Oceanicella actignis]SHN49915.1 peptidylprolyl isomerase [Oceanicella actignis]